MPLLIGKNIALMRKNKGMTQEQLASLIGVTAPAVSKWENGNGYPDITLLPAIARLLGTTLDNLLCFVPALSESQRRALIHDCNARFQRESFEDAYANLLTRVREYPNDDDLKYELCHVLDYNLSRIRNDKALLITVIQQQTVLLEQISANEEFRARALVELGYKYLQMDKADSAEKLISTLPTYNRESGDFLRLMFYMDRKRYDDALALARRNIADLSNDLLYTVYFIAIALFRQKQYESVLSIVGRLLAIHQALDLVPQAFNAYYLAARVHLALGEREHALDHLEAAVDCCAMLLGEPTRNALLFPPEGASEQDAALPLPDLDPGSLLPLERMEQELGREPRFRMLKERLFRLQSYKRAANGHITVKK